MSIKDYIKSKKTKNPEPDIVDTLTHTISELEAYLGKLNNGQIHNVNKYSEGSQNRHNAENMILQEKFVVSDALKSLKETKSAICHGRFVKETCHYDLDGRCDEI